MADKHLITELQLEELGLYKAHASLENAVRPLTSAS